MPVAEDGLHSFMAVGHGRRSKLLQTATKQWNTPDINTLHRQDRKCGGGTLGKEQEEVR